MKNVLAFVGALAVCAALSFIAVRARLPDPTKGWALQPIVVAAVDIEAGTAVTFEQISQRSLPEQFVSAAYVLPEDATLVVGKKVSLSLKAGDPFTWSTFADVSSRDAAIACVKGIKAAVDSEGSTAMDEALKKTATGPEPAEDPAVPAPVVDAQSMVEVVVAARDLEPGALASADLTVARVPAYLVTTSWVPSAEKESVAGARLLVRLQAGDAVWWQMLDDDEHPATTAGCTALVDAEVLARKKSAAASEAARWFDAKKQEVAR